MGLSESDFILLKKAFTPVEFTEEIEAFFHEVWSYKSYKKGTFITEAGLTEKYLFFVLEGVQVVYLIDKSGNQVVIGFTFDHEISCVYDSLVSQTPSTYFLEALADTKMLAISHENYVRLFEKFPEFNLWGRLFVERISMGRNSREIELITKTTKERYQAFIKRCPPQLKNIPQKYLASYLNMKPETFSRIRSNERF